MTAASETFARHSKRVLRALLAGSSIEDAARTAGCSGRSVKRWLARGRSEPDGPYGAFAEAVDGRREQEPGTSVPDREETLQLLSRAARSGSVAAMRELLRYHEQQSPRRAQPGPLDGFDELAARRDR